MYNYSFMIIQVQFTFRADYFIEADRILKRYIRDFYFDVSDY